MADRRLYHQVAKQIEALIDEGVFPAGSRLPGERELAEKFGVSRVTVREAEISLQAMGRIEIKTGSGVYVKERPSAGMIGLAPVSAFELTEARSLFESEAAALAAPIISDEELQRLDELLVEMSRGSKKDPAGEEADREFHMTIARATGNAAILFVIQSLWKMRQDLPDVKEVYDSVCQDDGPSRDDEHRDVLDALKNRDPKAARKAMRDHFTRLLQSMLQTTEELAVEEVRRKASESRERYMISANIG